ncbi:hypothetical protein PC9H_011082 [Pleurotus ostreatus]|uniref:Uncharacterized protein n=1 Tax=Pleurotus ostreatus TaxID=5322 RepID=A0A8H6ZQM7_PLEOS|nr:uncharacterized protein PC9H_011082 [Pleurotus ostreatus]KAF7422918.1 hypothetical protein PC9H_011082 [Pleurotus ostreatus]
MKFVGKNMGGIGTTASLDPRAQYKPGKRNQLASLLPLLFIHSGVDNGNQERPSIVAVSPLGVGRNGATTYDVAREIFTGGFNAINNGVSTFFPSAPVTIHATVVANSEGSVVTEAPQPGQPFAQHVVCDFNRGVGACVSHLFDDGAQITLPFSGRVVPLFTVTVDDVPGRNVQPTPPPSPLPSTPGGPGSPASGSANSPGVVGPGPASSVAAPLGPPGRNVQPTPPPSPLPSTPGGPGSPASGLANSPGAAGASSVTAPPGPEESNGAILMLHGSQCLYIVLVLVFSLNLFC